MLCVPLSVALFLIFFFFFKFALSFLKLKAFAQRFAPDHKIDRCLATFCICDCHKKHSGVVYCKAIL